MAAGVGGVQLGRVACAFAGTDAPFLSWFCLQIVCSDRGNAVVKLTRAPLSMRAKRQENGAPGLARAFSSPAHWRASSGGVKSARAKELRSARFPEPLRRRAPCTRPLPLLGRRHAALSLTMLRPCGFRRGVRELRQDP